MPYKNIVFVKLEKRLLNDPRWWSMSDSAQLIYVKLILLAAETYNKIPGNDIVLREALRSKLELEIFQKCLAEIQKNFPKLKRNKYFWHFDEFETKTNYIPKREIPRKSQGLPKVVTDKDKEEDIDKDLDKDKEYLFLKDNLFRKTLKDYLEMRVKIRKPATPRAVELVLQKLSLYPIQIAITMLENSIINNWQGVFEIKDQSNLTKAQKSNLQGLSKLMKELNNDESSVPTRLPGAISSISGPTV